jgi:hypothetical protein
VQPEKLQNLLCLIGCMFISNKQILLANKDMILNSARQCMASSAHFANNPLTGYNSNYIGKPKRGETISSSGTCICKASAALGRLRPWFLNATRRCADAINPSVHALPSHLHADSCCR